MNQDNSRSPSCRQQDRGYRRKLELDVVLEMENPLKNATHGASSSSVTTLETVTMVKPALHPVQSLLAAVNIQQLLLPKSSYQLKQESLKGNSHAAKTELPCIAAPGADRFPSHTEARQDTTGNKARRLRKKYELMTPEFRDKILSPERNQPILVVAADALDLPGTVLNREHLPLDPNSGSVLREIREERDSKWEEKCGLSMIPSIPRRSKLSINEQVGRYSRFFDGDQALLIEAASDKKSSKEKRHRLKHKNKSWGEGDSNIIDIAAVTSRTQETLQKASVKKLALPTAPHGAGSKHIRRKNEKGSLGNIYYEDIRRVQENAPQKNTVSSIPKGTSQNFSEKALVRLRLLKNNKSRKHKTHNGSTDQKDSFPDESPEKLRGKDSPYAGQPCQRRSRESSTDRRPLFYTELTRKPTSKRQSRDKDSSKSREKSGSEKKAKRGPKSTKDRKKTTHNAESSLTSTSSESLPQAPASSFLVSNTVVTDPDLTLNTGIVGMLLGKEPDVDGLLDTFEKTLEPSILLGIPLASVFRSEPPDTDTNLSTGEGRTDWLNETETSTVMASGSVGPSSRPETQTRKDEGEISARPSATKLRRASGVQKEAGEAVSALEPEGTRDFYWSTAKVPSFTTLDIKWSTNKLCIGDAPAFDLHEMRQMKFSAADLGIPSLGGQGTTKKSILGKSLHSKGSKSKGGKRHKHKSSSKKRSKRKKKESKKEHGTLSKSASVSTKESPPAASTPGANVAENARTNVILPTQEISPTDATSTKSTKESSQKSKSSHKKSRRKRRNAKSSSKKKRYKKYRRRKKSSDGSPLKSRSKDDRTSRKSKKSGRRKGRRSKSRRARKNGKTRDSSVADPKHETSVIVTRRTDWPNATRSFVISCLCIVILLSFIGIVMIAYSIIGLEKTPIPTSEVPSTTDSKSSSSESFSPEATVKSTTAASVQTPIAYHCTSAFCRQEAVYLKSLLKVEMEPCENFYHYVCDAWSQQNAADRSVWALVSRDTILQDELARKLLDAVKKSSESDVAVAARMHHLCAQQPQNGSQALLFARTMFSKWTIAHWPVTGSTGVETLDMVWDFAAEIHRDLDISSFVALTIGVNPEDNGQIALELSQPHFLLSEMDINHWNRVQRLIRGAIEQTMAEFEGQASKLLVDEVINILQSFVAVRSTSVEGTQRFIKTKRLDAGIQRLLAKLLTSVTQSGTPKSVVLMSPAYIQTQLPSLLNKLQPRALLNYMGLMALIQVAPFLSERLTDLRELFAKSFIGRTVANAADSSLLCIYSVEKLLPGCFSKAASALLRQNGDDLVLREWTSKLDSAFSIQAKSVAWIDQLSALLLRYRSKRSPISRFGPGDEPCSPSTQVTSGIPLLFYLEVSKLQHERKIRDIVKGSAHLSRQSHQSDLNTQAQYQPSWQTVYVPTALLNTSVPVTGTASAFHLPRFALRYYLALVEMLFENYYQGQVQVSFSNDAHRKLTSLLACLKDDLGNFPVKFNFSWQPRMESLPRAVLNRILALRFAYNAFLDQLHVRRVWGMDFRFDGLPELSAARLFFVYYALDNCESTGVAYDGGPSVDLPASYRVNMPLRYLEEFISAFTCKFYPISSCNVFKAAEIMAQSHG